MSRLLIYTCPHNDVHPCSSAIQLSRPAHMDTLRIKPGWVGGCLEPASLLVETIDEHVVQEVDIS